MCVCRSVVDRYNKYSPPPLTTTTTDDRDRVDILDLELLTTSFQWAPSAKPAPAPPPCRASRHDLTLRHRSRGDPLCKLGLRCKVGYPFTREGGAWYSVWIM